MFQFFDCTFSLFSVGIFLRPKRSNIILKSGRIYFLSSLWYVLDISAMLVWSQYIHVWKIGTWSISQVRMIKSNFIYDWKWAILFWNVVITPVLCVYRKSLQFADFWGNGNSRITKPRISRSPIYGSRCPLTVYYFLFIMLIGNYLSISFEKVAIF